MFPTNGYDDVARQFTSDKLKGRNAACIIDTDIVNLFNIKKMKDDSDKNTNKSKKKKRNTSMDDYKRRITRNRYITPKLTKHPQSQLEIFSNLNNNEKVYHNTFIINAREVEGLFLNPVLWEDNKVIEAIINEVREKIIISQDSINKYIGRQLNKQEAELFKILPKKTYTAEVNRTTEIEMIILREPFSIDDFYGFIDDKNFYTYTDFVETMRDLNPEVFVTDWYRTDLSGKEKCINQLDKLNIIKKYAAKDMVIESINNHVFEGKGTAIEFDKLFHDLISNLDTFEKANKYYYLFFIGSFAY